MLLYDLVVSVKYTNSAVLVILVRAAEQDKGVRALNYIYHCEIDVLGDMEDMFAVIKTVIKKCRISGY